MGVARRRRRAAWRERRPGLPGRRVGVAHRAHVVRQAWRASAERQHPMLRGIEYRRVTRLHRRRAAQRHPCRRAGHAVGVDQRPGVRVQRAAARVLPAKDDHFVGGGVVHRRVLEARDRRSAARCRVDPLGRSTHAIGERKNPRFVGLEEAIPYVQIAAEDDHPITRRIVDRRRGPARRRRRTDRRQLRPCGRPAKAVGVGKYPDVVSKRRRAGAVAAGRTAKHDHAVARRVVHRVRRPAGIGAGSGRCELAPSRRTGEPAGVCQHPDVVQRAAICGPAEHDRAVVCAVRHQGVTETGRWWIRRRQVCPLFRPGAGGPHREGDGEEQSEEKHKAKASAQRGSKVHGSF